MRRKKSFVNEILIYLLVLVVLLLVILGGFLLSSYGILKKEMKDSSDALLSIYRNECSNDIAEMNGLLKSITTQSVDLANIKSSSENRRALSSVALVDYMQKLITGNELADVVVIYDGNYNICLDAITPGFNYNKKNNLREYTLRAVTEGGVSNHQWDFVELNQETYLYKMLLSDNRAIAIYIRTSKLLSYMTSEDNANRIMTLVNAEGRIGKLWGSVIGDFKEGASIDDMKAVNYYSNSQSVVEDQLRIYCYTRKTSILQQTHSSMVIVGTGVCLTVLFMLFVLYFTRKEIAVPMHQVVQEMELIKSGEYENRIDTEFHTKEFVMLQEATNQMLDEIVGLKIQTYEKRIELQDMELKSIRLQLKPHFFLNALTTISSLSSQGKNIQIKTYIDALSRNVRYMFRAGFHTVAVREEIRHVENYFAMQELKYPGCMFYLVDLPQHLEEWKIPQMLIHTFVENEYKYVVSMDKVLTLLIKISSVTKNGEELLLIEIEDDGNGYPVEVLEYMNKGSENPNSAGTRIGLWSIKRRMELMYERKDLVVLENINPHGCLNKIYVPKKPVHELEEETIHTKL